MNFLKKMSLLGFVFILPLTLVACGASTSSVGTGKGRENSDETASKKVNEQLTDSSGNLGDYTITIYDDFEIMDYYDGSHIIVITYDFTNHSDENQTFLTAISDKAFQNGIQIERAFLVDLIDAHKFKGASAEIQPGATITIKEAYILRDTTSPVSIEVKEFLSLNNNKITKEFHLQ